MKTATAQQDIHLYASWYEDVPVGFIVFKGKD